MIKKPFIVSLDDFNLQYAHRLVEDMDDHYMCVTRESMHLGQLASWRSTMNHSSVLTDI